MTDPLGGLVERLWATHRDRLHERLERVLVGLDALDGGQPVDTQALAGDCHVLTGALGMYGRPGSELLRETEHALLSAPTALDATGLARRLRVLREELHR